MVFYKKSLLLFLFLLGSNVGLRANDERIKKIYAQIDVLEDAIKKAPEEYELRITREEAKGHHPKTDYIYPDSITACKKAINELAGIVQPIIHSLKDKNLSDDECRFLSAVHIVFEHMCIIDSALSNYPHSADFKSNEQHTITVNKECILIFIQRLKEVLGQPQKPQTKINKLTGFAVVFAPFEYLGKKIQKHPVVAGCTAYVAVAGFVGYKYYVAQQVQQPGDLDEYEARA